MCLSRGGGWPDWLGLLLSSLLHLLIMIQLSIAMLLTQNTSAAKAVAVTAAALKRIATLAGDCGLSLTRLGCGGVLRTCEGWGGRVVGDGEVGLDVVNGLALAP